MTMKCKTGCPYIDNYHEDIRTGRVKASNALKLAVDYIERKLNDPDVFIDNDRIEKAKELIERYFGYMLLPWEMHILALVHCYYKSSDTVVFNQFFILVGRGNGKNGFISGLVWYLTTHYHGVKGYNVDIIANSEDQAKTSFEDIYEVLEETKEKSSKFFKWNREEIKNLRTNSYIKYNTSTAKKKDGKRSACLVFDEVHEYENAAKIGVFRSGFGKRKHSRIFKITTNGYVREGVLDDDLRLANDVLNGIVTEIGLCPLLYQMDSDDECLNPELWEKANPSLRYFPALQHEMKTEFVEMRYDKQVELDFYTKRMNRPRTKEELPVASREDIEATNRELPDLTGKPCVVGIDFAMLNDWAAVNFHFWDDDMRYDIGRYWVCTQSPDISRIRAPWQTWEQCVAVDEPEISPYLLAEWICEMGQKYSIQKIYVDNFRLALLSKALDEIGFSVSRGNLVITRPSDVMKIVPVINSAFINHQLVWGDNPALRWATNNTKLIPSGRKEGTETGNYVYGKIEGKSRKTDPFDAFVRSMIGEKELYTLSGSVFDDLPVIIG